MSNNIEDITVEEALKEIETIKKLNTSGIVPCWKAINKVLEDRERKIEDIQRLQELLDKLEANNVKLEKEVYKYKNMYEAEHRIHLVRNEQLDRKEIAVQKANKYDVLVNTIREEIEKRNIQAREHKDKKILTIIEREKLTLQNLLETIEGEKK